MGDMLGKCDRVVVGKDDTTIVTGDDNNDALAKRIEQIRAEAAGTDNKFDKEKAEERVAALGGGTALYMSCDNDLKERILAECRSDDEDEKLGVEIMFRSLPGPIKQIAKNAGLEGEVVADKCRHREFGFGYNAATDTYEDLLKTGVLDPAKVTINAIENAASIAALVLTTEVLITEIPDKTPVNVVGGDPNYM